VPAKTWKVVTVSEGASDCCCCQGKSTAQHSTAQHSTAQHSTAQHSTAQHSTAQHSTAQLSSAPTCSHGIILTCSILAFKPELAAGAYDKPTNCSTMPWGTCTAQSNGVCHLQSKAYQQPCDQHHRQNPAAISQAGQQLLSETNIPHVCCMCWVNKLQHKLLSRSEQKADFSVCDQAACHH